MLKKEYNKVWNYERKETNMGNLAFWLVLAGFTISFSLAFKAFLEL